ncbi:hypothetical protein C7S14_6139 [Burkholderia cepacia]|nr:hypothetical protein [Burkholderia cepacia]QOH33264.1 hypothetical protein C7S14_6139 [Burkholderia cepacia]
MLFRSAARAIVGARIRNRALHGTGAGAEASRRSTNKE